MSNNNIRPPHEEAICVTPLNSMPHIGPSTSLTSFNALHHQGNTEPQENLQPALLFLPSQPSEEDWSNLFAVSKNGIGLTGSAAAGFIGPPLGKMDIGESDNSYMFRVALPGVAREDFTCDVAPNGHIVIKGVTTTGEKTVFKNSLRFEMQSCNLCPPGHFLVSFRLPGPVDSQHLSAHFGIDGVFEGIVQKRTQAH